MAKLTRRGFLGQTSAGVATFGLLAAVPLATSPEMTDIAASDAAATELTAAELAGPIVAHVRDFATGEIGLMVGTREIIYHDSELVARLLRAAP
jgi:hypothetical protein